MSEHQDRITAAIEIAMRHKEHDEPHHKDWCIDQMVRALTGCPTVQASAVDCNGSPYTYDKLGESEEYRAFVADACAGEDGPDTYDWNVGIAP